MKAQDRLLWGIIVMAGLLLLLFGGLTVSVMMTPPVHPDVSQVPSHPGDPPEPGQADRIETARGLARALVADENLPGLSVAVGSSRRIVWAEGFGWADIEARVPVTPRTRFRIGSVSEAFTAAAAARLHQRGRLDLDAPVQRYVPSFPTKTWSLTMRHLLGHTGGVRNVRFEAEQIPRRHCDDVLQGLETFAQDPLRFRPGTEVRHSTHGFVLASAVVQRAAEEPFPGFMAREIFEPLGMGDTLPEAREAIADRTAFYHPRMFELPRLGLDPASEVDFSCWSGAGMFLSTPSDLVRFAVGIREGGLLDAETVRMMESPFVLESGEPGRYGIGWVIEPVSLGGAATQVLIKTGDVMGGTAVLMVVPSRDVAIALASNVSLARSIRKLADTLADRFAGPAPIASP